MSLFLLIGCILLCELVGIIGGFATIKSIKTWYKKLKKPFFNPPAFVFGPAWTILYFLMGIALFLVITSNGNKSTALLFFFMQLLFNFSWTFIFFYFRKIGLAFLEIICLWLSILATIFYFYPINSLASYLLIPYLLWVTFASILNEEVWRLNR